MAVIFSHGNIIKKKTPLKKSMFFKFFYLFELKLSNYSNFYVQGKKGYRQTDRSGLPIHQFNNWTY